MFSRISDLDIFLENVVSTKPPSFYTCPSWSSLHLVGFDSDTFFLDQIVCDIDFPLIDVLPLVLPTPHVDVELTFVSTPIPRPISSKCKRYFVSYQFGDFLHDVTTLSMTSLIWRLTIGIL